MIEEKLNERDEMDEETKIEWPLNISQEDKDIIIDLIKKNEDEFYLVAFCNIMGEWDTRPSTDLNILITQPEKNLIQIHRL